MSLLFRRPSASFSALCDHVMGFANATSLHTKLDAMPHPLTDKLCADEDALQQLVAMFRYASQCESGWEISPTCPLSRPGTIQLAGHAVS